MDWTKRLKAAWVPKTCGGHLLKAEQVYGLIVQLVHAAASVLGGGLADDGGGEAKRGSRLQAAEQQGQHHGGGMCDHDRRGLQRNFVGVSQFAFSTQGARRTTSVLFSRA